MMRAVRVALGLGLAPWAGALAALPRPAQPLPLFAREERLACASCHGGPTRLSPAGMAYALAGYPAGAPEHDSRGALASRSLSAPLPLSVVALAGTGASGPETGASEAERDRWRIEPRGVHLADLHTLAHPGANVALRLEAGVGRRSGLIESQTAFVQCRDVLGRGGFSVKAGLFDAELPFLSNRLRATLHPTLAPLAREGRGLELIGQTPVWAAGVGRIASPRSLLQSDRAGRLLGRPEDTELWLRRDLHGAELGASVLFDRQDSSLPSLTWMQHVEAQGGGLIPVGRLTLVPGYVFDRFDDRPAAGIHDRRQYYLLEAEAPLDARRRWQLTARVEREYETRTVLTPERDRDLEVANLSCDVVPGATVALEGALARDDGAGHGVGSLDAFIRVSY